MRYVMAFGFGVFAWVGGLELGRDHHSPGVGFAIWVWFIYEDGSSDGSGQGIGKVLGMFSRSCVV